MKAWIPEKTSDAEYAVRTQTWTNQNTTFLSRSRGCLVDQELKANLTFFKTCVKKDVFHHVK